MEINKVDLQKLKGIFKKGSVTYYYSSLFFPKEIRKAVLVLYTYLRTADDLVDFAPPKTKEFEDFRKKTKIAFSGKKTNDLIIDSFAKLVKEYSLDKKWVEAFLDSMEMDLTKKQYQTYKELEKYIYGSAEVIGLMMAKLLDLPKESHLFTKLQGRAMQLINAVRDIEEDMNLFKRVYIPQEDIKGFGLRSLIPTSKGEEKKFKKLVRFEIDRFKKVQREAEKGYRFLPKRYLLPIKTAMSVYKWTANEISRNPLIVFEKKVKRKKLYIYYYFIKNWLTI